MSPALAHLRIFQLKVAARWLERGNSSKDVYARFFFYFSGINALYFYWSQADNLRGSGADGEPYESEQLQHLLLKAKTSEAAALVERCHETVQFLLSRRPIQKMGRRQDERPAEGIAGPRERALQVQLRQGSPEDKLEALGQVLYQIRCNLVHGSKMAFGDDETVITKSVPALREILDWAADYTEYDGG